MKKRLLAVLLSIILVLSFSTASFACNEEQSKEYVLKMLFGSSAYSYEHKENVELLMKALYLCCEQADGNGQKYLKELKNNKVRNLPSLDKINVSSSNLYSFSHSEWGKNPPNNNYEKEKNEREKVLKNTVNKVLNDGFWSGILGINSDEYDDFAVLLYYFHILADYVDATQLETTSFHGNIETKADDEYYAVEIVNGDIPFFTEEEKNIKEPFVSLSPLDDEKRCGVAFALVSQNTMASSDTREGKHIDPSGWQQKSYGGNTLYDRSHLVAHKLAGKLDGIDSEENIITGTSYLNKNVMRHFENRVRNYIDKNEKNHVLYRVTPIFEGTNQLASGVQMEAYSIEDSGKLHFNVYCHNVKLGVDINYENGVSKENALSHLEEIIPFISVNNAEEDLVTKIDYYLRRLFKDQEHSETYDGLLGSLKNIAGEAKGKNGNLNAMSKYINEYYEALNTQFFYLLQNEDFFNDLVGKKAA